MIIMTPIITDNKIVLVRYIGGQMYIQTFEDAMELVDKLIFDGDIGDGREGSQMHILAIKNFERRLARYKTAHSIF